MVETLVLIGGGGHCRSCIDVIESKAIFIAGILDDNLRGCDILGYKVLGGDELINELIEGNHFFLVTVGQIKSAETREKIFERILTAGGNPATVLSGSSMVSKSSTLGKGTIVMHQAMINSNSLVGVNCIINSKSLVEHDCIIGDHSHLSTAAIINGGCTIGSRVFVGSNSVINQAVKVTDDVIIGSGAVVLYDITEPGLYVGNPARKING